MSRRQTIARWSVLSAGVLLILIGLLHAVVNIRGLQRTIARGDITERLGQQMIANATFGGAALVVLGVILLVVAQGLVPANRTVWRIGVIIGLFLVVLGVAAYLWMPVPAVLMFSGFGALVAVPLLAWRRELTSG